MVFHSGSIAPREVESVTLRAKRERQVHLIVQTAGDQDRSLSEMKGLPDVDSNLFHDYRGKLPHDFAAKQGTMAGEELSPSDVGIDLRQLGNKLVQ
jgi:hypothetical protein